MPEDEKCKAVVERERETERGGIFFKAKERKSKRGETKPQPKKRELIRNNLSRNITK